MLVGQYVLLKWGRAVMVWLPCNALSCCTVNTLCDIIGCAKMCYGMHAWMGLPQPAYVHISSIATCEGGSLLDQRLLSMLHIHRIWLCAQGEAGGMGTVQLLFA